MIRVKIVFFLILLFITNVFSQGTEFHLTYTNEVSNKPISGRVLLILNEDTLIDPDIPNPFQPSITFGMDFKNWKPGEELILTGSNTDSYLSSIEKLNGDYSLRAVIDTDTASCLLLKDGMFYSNKINFNSAPGKLNVIDVKVNNVLSGMGFKESEYTKLLKLQSDLLSDFYNTPSFIEAAVILPDSYYSDSTRYYPVVFVFPGWGTTHIAPSRNDFQQKRYGMKSYGEEKIFVVLNQDCRFGFHVFADSDNNGPRAKSFINEFIPYLENRYRVVKNPNARFLTGQSSGAWAALWLLVNYPDEFGMTWAASPDPVDFRDFAGHNLYSKDANIFYDSDGNLTSAIRSPEVVFTNKQWSDMETVLGEGGQYQSFEAVFGKRDENNKPEQIYDRKTGEIFQETLEHWKNYDINIFVQKNAGELKNKLAGKINIVVSDNDDFYLDGSIRLFKETLDSLGLKANIKFLKDGGHNTWNDEIRTEMHGKMDEIFLRK
jgi:S-formylglutathione hydrolase FrmB